jgi:hypothetical protein
MKSIVLTRRIVNRSLAAIVASGGRTAVSMDAAGPAFIEVGASHNDGSLRYWLAKEAVTKGETLLGSQSMSLGRLSFAHK